MFTYLKEKLKRKLYFDPQNLTIDELTFAAHDWYELHRDAKKGIPKYTLAPRGNMVSTHCFVEADHARYRDTRRSQIGVLIFVNKEPIL